MAVLNGPGGGPQVACLLLVQGGDPDLQRDDGLELDWLATCRSLTPIVERVSPRCALLDLGACSERAAQTALEDLLRSLARIGFVARAGIAPGITLAHLAAQAATSRQPAVLVTRENAQGFLRGVPVSALLSLAGPEWVTTDVVARLERYGLRTLGQLARLGELTLRRQFGAVGGTLPR